MTQGSLTYRYEGSRANIILRHVYLLPNEELKAWSILKYWLPCVHCPIELSTDGEWMVGISPTREVFMNTHWIVLSGHGLCATTTLLEWLKITYKESKERCVSLGPSPGLGCNQGGRFRVDINAFKGLCWVGLLCDGLVLGGRSWWMGGCWMGVDGWVLGGSFR